MHTGRWRVCVENLELKMRTHGEAVKPQTAEYRTWASMKRRCQNPNTINYRQYGGAGVTVCKRWLQYENFLEDMGRRPSPRHTLERRNNALGYRPSNCCWATYTEQNINKPSVAKARRLAKQIRAASTGKWGEQRVLARKFNLSQQQISRIIRGTRCGDLS